MAYQFILIPALVVIITQIVKLSIDKIRGNMTVQNIFISYGGMPSAHTAFAVSITTLLAFEFGLASPLFAASAVFTIIIMRDATTFRNILGKQGRAFNEIRAALPKDKQKNYPRFSERVGHSVSEVAVGAVFGAALSILLREIISVLV